MNPIENKAAFQALAGIAENNPLVRTAIKYWWLAIPAGIVMYYKIRKAPEMSLETILTSFGVSFGPIIPLIMLSESMSNRTAAPSPAPQVKDAQFQVVSQPSVTATPQPFPS